MFGLFKRKITKPNVADLFLRVDDASFVRAVRSGLEPGSPAIWVMCAVAYQNLGIMMKFSLLAANTKPDEGLPGDIDSMIRFLSAACEKETNEISKRRMMWFFQAALIQRATDKASADASLRNDVAEIWIMMTRGCALLKQVVDGNIASALWLKDETAYFDFVRDEKNGMKYCLTHLMPKYLTMDNEKVAAFALEHDIWLPWHS